MNDMPYDLLATDEPARIAAHRENDRSPFLMVVDHAGNLIPHGLGGRGLPKTECERHIAWDIGVAAFSRFVADALHATLVQRLRCSLLRDVGNARS